MWKDLKQSNIFFLCIFYHKHDNNFLLENAIHSVVSIELHTIISFHSHYLMKQANSP